jgi:hypothetical protein
MGQQSNSSMIREHRYQHNTLDINIESTCVDLVTGDICGFISVQELTSFRNCQK